MTAAQAASRAPEPLRLSTRREVARGVDIDDVLYLFNDAGIMPAADLDHVLAVNRWVHAGLQIMQTVSAGETVDSAVVAAAGVPERVSEMDAAIMTAARICLPSAPEETLRAVGRDGMAQIIVSFLAVSRPGSSASPPTTSNRATRRARK